MLVYHGVVVLAGASNSTVCSKAFLAGSLRGARCWISPECVENALQWCWHATL